MKVIKYLLAILLSLVVGFLFAGLYGALAVGVIMSLSIALITSTFQLTRVAYRIVLFSSVSYLIMLGVGLLNANESVHFKVSAIKKELRSMGYDPICGIISQKRYPLYNQLLVNSVDNSKHLKGKAIDLYVYDINGDGVYTINDFELFNKASRRVDKKFPAVSGAVYHYLEKGFFSRRMIHVELHD